MKQYKVFQHPSGTAEAVKQGWSWPAFFFSVVWAMVKKQWALAVLVLIGTLAVRVLVGASDSGQTGEGLVNLIGFIINLVFGAAGNSWHERNLISRGYQFSNTVSAANAEGAVALSLSATPAKP